jgi:predicted dehydrogenase
VSRKVNWGVLSTANIAREHVIPAMQAGEATNVVAIASRDERRAREVAAELGIAKAYGSYEALLQDPEIEAIYNPLPNHLHAPLTIKALEAGKHVLCEKPIALNAVEANQIEEAQQRTGLLVAEAFMVRFHPQWQRVRDIVRSGRLGDVRAIHTIFSYFLADPDNIRNQADIGGGGLYDVGCYAINTARYLFESEPERVLGLFAIDPGLKTDRMMSGLAEFSDSRHLVFTCGTQLVLTQYVQVLGTLARVEIEIPFNAPAGAETSISIDDGRDLTGGGREVVRVPACNQFTLQGDAFSRAVLGEHALEWGAADAVLNMRVIDAFFRSARSKTWERPLDVAS